MKRRLLISLSALALTACNSSNTGTPRRDLIEGQACSVMEDCIEGHLCIEQICRRLCAARSDCQTAQECVDGTCQTLAERCGNGVIESGELCDDGNPTLGDGCDDSCRTEAGWSCEGVPSSCSTQCGDGIIAGMEICVDANASTGDGCDGRRRRLLRSLRGRAQQHM